MLKMMPTVLGLGLILAGCDDVDDVTKSPRERQLPMTQVLTSCKDWVSERVSNPSTLSFQHFRSDYEAKPGASVWRTQFKARNDFNLEKTFDLSCQVAWDGTITAFMSETH